VPLSLSWKYLPLRSKKFGNYFSHDRQSWSTLWTAAVPKMFDTRTVDLWVMTQCSLVDNDQLFGGIYWLQWIMLVKWRLCCWSCWWGETASQRRPPTGLLFTPRWYRGEPWRYDIGKGNPLIRPPVFWKSYQQSSGSRQEERTKGTMNLAFRSTSVHICKCFYMP
jgi:hypothetical protein